MDCRFDALVSVDSRGQLVLPKELRKKMGMKAGDKLAVVCYEKEGRVCCLTLIKGEQLDDMAREVLKR